MTHDRSRLDRLIRFTSLTAAVILLCACIPGGKPTVPMAVATISAGAEGADVIVFLPGIRNDPSDFISRDFHNALPASLQIVAADAHFGYYRSRTLTTRLDQDVLPRPRLERSVTLTGVSLGGLGALLCYCETQDAAIERIVLLAPFLGDEEMIEHIASAPSLRSWTADPSIGREFERKLWSCLRDVVWNQPTTPEIWLGYGTEDDMAPAHRLLGALLPDHQIITVEGGHRWSVWQTLWQEIVVKVADDDWVNARGWSHEGRPIAQQAPHPRKLKVVAPRSN